ncbi:GEVED domain-containing protein [Aequorivita sinensis]|uniref:GEVED domain-containing protein n=1 Tax=Aequorivita sinensis TaxID=1382458 RepID=UPI00230043E2|nr:GEVED domain-containing protein [Aequorivita sinensis]
MKKSTLIGCFIGLLALTMNAQVTQPSTSTTVTGTTKTEVQKKSNSSIQDLLVRYNNVGKYNGSISDHFTTEEQQMLRSYFKAQNSTTNSVRGVNSNISSDAPNSLLELSRLNGTVNTNPFYQRSSNNGNSARISDAPLTLSEQAIANGYVGNNPRYQNAIGLTSLEQAEILAAEAAAQQRNAPNFNVQNQTTQNRVLSQIVPTAGATETFAVVPGDFFYDPSDGTTGGPGGDCSTTSSGDPGDYPNCNCATVTTLTGTDLSVEFLSFRVFGNFDYLNIYDGPDTSSPQIYDSNLNSDTDELAGMIAANGSAVFTSTTGALTFEFYATSVVNTCGWEVEVLSGGGGGSFPAPYCGPLEFNSGVEPITLVEVAGISNVSDATIDGSPAHEDFTAISGDMEEGMSYPIALEGNTGGGFTNSFTVFIDWNQDGILDNASERYEIGTINGSTGTDGQQATGTIDVPAGVLEGPTRMRVIKKFLSSYATDSCDPGSSYGQAEDYTINVTAAGGGGTGGPCATSGPSNGFENGKSFLKNLGRIVAHDLTVVDGENMTLESITITAFIGAQGSGVNADNVDVFIYADDGSGAPGALITSQTNLVPDSQTVIGSNFGFDAWSVVLDIADVDLPGQNGADTTYWIGLSLEPTDGSNTFWENSTAGAIGYGEAYDDGLGGGYVVDSTLEGVYTFDGTCEPIGGGGTGGPCVTTGPSNGLENGKSFLKNLGRIAANDLTVADGENMTLESITITAFIGAQGSGVNADNVDVFIYADDGSGAPGALITSQTNLVPDSQTVIGSNFGFDAWSVVLDIADVDLPGQNGADTTYWIGLSLEPTDGSNTFWENSTAGTIGYGEAYDDGLGGGYVVDSTLEGVYSFEGTCEPIGGGGGPGPLTTVYGINNGNLELIGFGVATPQNTEVFGSSPVTVNFENAGAIDPANPTTGYVLDNGGDFFSFDVVTGIYTALGNIPGDWVGMEFDQTSGILYALAGNSLYTVDPVAVTATLVGAMNMPAADLPIALAIDGNGVGYTYDLVTDTFHSVDLATAASTPIGNIGFVANFGQGMAWDPTTDTVYMAAFNSDTFQAEWRSVDLSTGMTTLIGPIVTTAATTQVAWASVGETLDPPTCPEPTFLTVTNITPTSVDLSWTGEPNASNGYIWYIFDAGANPTTDTPVVTGTTPSGTTSATATGLTSGMNYDFYVVADCGTVDGLSTHAGPVTFATPPACGDKFYDDGGPNGDYSNSANITTTIVPDVSGDVVTVTFLSFETEANWDALYVYDGPDATAPIISSGNPGTTGGFPPGGYWGSTIPGPFTSTHPSGALTFVFMSDGSFAYSGWEADITCAPVPPPNDKIANSIDVDEIGFPYTDPQVNMPAATTEDGNPNGCDLTGANGVWYNFVPTGDGTATATIVTPGGASSVTFYTAPNENAVETDLTLVDQNTNQCAPGTSASINTVAGQVYYVFVLNNGAETDIVIDGTNLGIADNTIEGFSFYPNPTTTILNMNSVDNIESVALFNMLGQRVIDAQINATTSQLDVSSLSTGTYIMRVTANGQTGSYRVIKN